MPNTTITITCVDLWPKIKFLVASGGNVREEGPFPYDIALSQSTPAVQNAMRLAVESIINTRKGR